MSGHIDAIFTAPTAGAPVVRRDSVAARPGIGLDGDRYALRVGYWSDRNVVRDLTLIEMEAIESVCAAMGTRLDAGAFRRNIVTRDVRLDELVGVRFRVGSVEVIGTGRCAPCDHLQQVVGAPVLRPLIGRGGLRAAILTGGTIVVGAAIAAIDPTTRS